MSLILSITFFEVFYLQLEIYISLKVNKGHFLVLICKKLEHKTLIRQEKSIKISFNQVLLKF